VEVFGFFVIRSVRLRVREAPPPACLKLRVGLPVRDPLDESVAVVDRFRIPVLSHGRGHH
jgi:hypothetical protein